MRVIGVSEPGGPEALREFDIDERHAGPGEVRIRVRAAAVNPTDTAARSGAYASRQADVSPPHVPGMDAAGDIDEVGPGTTTDLAVGDAVMAVVVPSGSHGAYSEQLVVSVESVVPVPVGADYAEAATLPMNGLTARMALDAMALEPGQTLAVTGAAGAFGGYMIQLAKAEGLRVIADAAADDEQLVRDLGADVVVPRGDDVADRIREAEPGGVDALADGAVQNELVSPAVRDGGQMATVRGFKGDDAAKERGVVFHPVLVMHYNREQAKLDALRKQAEAGVLTLRVARTFPADHAAEAHRLFESGGVRGRLILEF
ncbi:NADP-dependent oxidoreductase [Streptomonospora litoralis]|uniref:Zinc-type alcohol dehydrogenase-like protein n=1 Tax=Streptomonospora litoralis TaxID=2498135 RepID=A0A4P6Q0H7_9ACTN|nr:NADP-dependent oxidoreductase [Streptomonospora litoralis]QBI53570.1 Zinc-type alcohol dehydrogenase-like protein [Streptomonospora litoralis]